MEKTYQKKIGDIGEKIAEKYLQQKGYKIVGKNYRCREGEIDLISRKNDSLFFVEVKTRTSLSYGPGEESVGENKINKIHSAIYNYLEKNKINNTKWNLLIISIIIDKKNKKYKIREIKYF